MRRNSLNSLVFAVTLTAALSTAAIAQDSPTYLTSFRVAPISALRGAASAIAPMTGKQAFNSAELGLLQDAADGRIDNFSMAQALLIIAGVTDPNDMQRYLAKLDQIAVQASEAVAKATTEAKKARALGKFLQEGPLKAGYVSGQYDVLLLLNTGHYNCVSSAILYNATASRLGIAVGAVQIPGHVFTRIDGYDVEPTSGGVYARDKREERIEKEKDKEGGKEGYYATHTYRETTNMGLLAEVYYDEGCKLGEQKKYREAIVSYIKAACLDPENPNVPGNLRNAFRNAFKESLQNRQFAQAMTIARFYRELLLDTSSADQMMKEVASAAR